MENITDQKKTARAKQGAEQLCQNSAGKHIWCQYGGVAVDCVQIESDYRQQGQKNSLLFC